jgi:hypothetical protein
MCIVERTIYGKYKVWDGDPQTEPELSQEEIDKLQDKIDESRILEMREDEFFKFYSNGRENT